MRFQRLELRDWRQFDTVQVDFHPRLTVLTGVNGAGKTTLLNILSQHFGWNTPFISTARPTRKGIYRYFTRWIAGREDDGVDGDEAIGALHYVDGHRSRLVVPESDNPNFQVHIPEQRPVPGLFLPSHRPVYSYQQVEQIPTRLDARQELFEQYFSNLRQFYSPGRARIDSPSFRLKAALISLGTFGYGNEVVARNEEAIETFEGFQEILRKVLPPQLEFRRLAIRMPDIVFECAGDNDFSLDAASGGVAAIVDVAWQIYMKSLIEEGEFAVLADEPENHLHPELQRSLLPGLMAAFPMVQFIVATHNPFMVTSVPESHVFVLHYYEGKVHSRVLPDVDRSASANRVLMDVLGVSFPMPLWVEARVNEIVTRVQAENVSAEALHRARDELNEVGFGHLFPDVVERLLQDGEGGRRDTEGGRA
jgi:energy-coupling factor transporter ATP-binding protein EcfA2